MNIFKRWNPLGKIFGKDVESFTKLNDNKTMYITYIRDKETKNIITRFYGKSKEQSLNNTVSLLKRLDGEDVWNAIKTGKPITSIPQKKKEKDIQWRDGIGHSFKAQKRLMGENITFKQLLESYNDAERIFSMNNDANVVKNTLHKFKELSKKNLIKDKDITKWIKKPFTELKNYVESAPISKKEIKSFHKQNSIKLIENDEWAVIVPLTKEASCLYGKGTRWCTAATLNNKFKKYINEGWVLLYIINKNDDRKFALLTLKDSSARIAFDSKNRIIHYSQIEDETEISFNEIIDKLQNIP